MKGGEEMDDAALELKKTRKIDLTTKFIYLL